MTARKPKAAPTLIVIRRPSGWWVTWENDPERFVAWFEAEAEALAYVERQGLEKGEKERADEGGYH